MLRMQQNKALQTDVRKLRLRNDPNFCRRGNVRYAFAHGFDDGINRSGWNIERTRASLWRNGSRLCYRQTESQAEFLVLHRAHSGPDYEGDWAWTPPAVARQAGEEIDACAAKVVC